MTERRVVVTGYGAVSAMGNSAAEIWDGIMAYQLGYKKWSFDDPSINAKFFSFMEADRKRYAAFPKAVVKMLPEFAKNALLASKEALDMAFDDSANLHQHQP